MEASPATPRLERQGEENGFFVGGTVNQTPEARAAAAFVAASAGNAPTGVPEADMRDAQTPRANSEIAL